MRGSTAGRPKASLRAASARIAELLGWPRDDDLRVIEWLGGKEFVQRVHESGKFR